MYRRLVGGGMAASLSPAERSSLVARRLVLLLAARRTYSGIGVLLFGVSAGPSTGRAVGAYRAYRELPRAEATAPPPSLPSP